MAHENKEMLRAFCIVYFLGMASALSAHFSQVPDSQGLETPASQGPENLDSQGPEKSSVEEDSKPRVFQGVDYGGNTDRIDMLKPIKTMKHNASYGNSAASQLAYLKYMLPDILDSLNKQEGSVVYDLGCADALNTMVMLNRIKKIKPEFTAGLIDLEANDWDVARNELAGYVGEVVPKTGYYQPIQTMPLRSIVGTGLGIKAQDFEEKTQNDGEWAPPRGAAAVLMGASFYQQVAQSGSVNVAVSNSAVQFLSGSTLGIANLQAEADWLDFLRGREAELVEGGTLHVSGLARASDDRYPSRSFMHLHESINPALEEALKRDLISTEQKNEFKLPIYHRTDFEWQAPFLNGEVVGLKLEKFELVAIRSPYWTEAKYNMKNFQELYVPSMLAWIEPYMESQLGPEVVNIFKEHLNRIVEASPWNFQDDYLQAVMVIRKPLFQEK